jgi:hypothetical protein
MSRVHAFSPKIFFAAKKNRRNRNMVIGKSSYMDS